MRWKPIRFVPDDTKIHFIRVSRFGFFLSGILCAVAIALFAFKGLNYGIDFKGGSEIAIRTQGPAQLDKLRNELNNIGLGSIELQQFGSPQDVKILVPAQGGGDANEQAAQLKVIDTLKSLEAGVEIRSKDTVGGKVSEELTQQATGAVMLSILFVLFYLWARFEWQFAMGAVISLLHDVVLSIGLFSLIGLEFNLSIIAAILTIVGYSLNDTVVVFDRVREFLRRYKSMNLADLIDFSINSVLPRTMLTSVATLMALLALYFFGGEVIRGFSFAMIWGVVVGTYSSIFIAAPVLILLGTKREISSSEANPEKGRGKRR
ncbi:protein translocase subunit SecF [Aestuariivirga litoralis]|uniref:protein translocase subunit SecF n=1 Tax=Aestuariivirga litoralis TaxID=2650924 RepID=UPI0018C720B4|nr:protein translocase subunit SecF [Aestuariivirga litoralis]MBG1231474.1 protein translocase subunit SecF [Aestuariivirga litoralis]